MYKLLEGNSVSQPREKAIEYGIKYLNDNELLSILLGCGTKNNPVEKLANQLLLLLDKSNGEATIEDLKNLRGIGSAKATLITAALEFSRRRLCPLVNSVTYPTDILPAIRHFVTRPQEYFIVISLNGAHEVIKSRVVSIGILNRTLINPNTIRTQTINTKYY